jgi:PAS domain S-box-containing protein
MSVTSQRRGPGEPPEPRARPAQQRQLPEGSAKAARRLTPAAGGHPALDRIAALAAQLLGAASAQVSLLSDVQTVAGGAGLPPGTVGADSPLEESLCTVTASAGGPLVVTDAVVDARVCALPPVTSGSVASYLGVPLVADDGNIVGALCVFDAEPRPWSDADVALLTQLATSAVAELELSSVTAEYEAGQVLLGLAIDAAGIGTFDWDLTTGKLTWDERLLDLFGYDVGDFGQTIEGFNARVHPDDLPRVTETLKGAIEGCGDYESDYRVALPDGHVRWVTSRGRALCDESGATVRVLGAAFDTTSRRDSEARVVRVLESMSAAFYSLDRDWRFDYVNAEAERLIGRPREELLGQSVWELFPAAVASTFEDNFRRAVVTGQPVTFEAFYPAPLDGWFELRAWPSADGLSVYFLDITGRRTAQERAERAARRAALLAEVTSELTGTMDAEEAVARLAELVVPTLADWCIVTLVDDEHAAARHGLRDVGWWHTDPAARPLVERYAQTRMQALTDDSFLARVLATGRVVSIPESATEAIRQVLLPGENRDLLARLAPESATLLPLPGRGRTVGLLSLFNGPERGPLSGEDAATARDVAGRAGLALDNSRLYEQQRRLAEGLQRSLLTDPPEPDHVQVVVRYQPAAEAAQVGGDWYDAFLQPDGALVLVIGDVIGHDTQAAAAMGQLRGLLRGIAADSGDGPAGVLSRVDRVMETLQIRTTATVVVARIEQTPDERARGITHVRWSNAGHPPPMVINPDGTVAALPAVQADLLLGIEPGTKRVESEVTLDRGATVLLYTDGLVERRGQSLDDGLAQLRDQLEVLADLTLDELVDQLLVRMLPPRAEDDVALIAVRLHRQDRPRPAEAGPNRIPANVDDQPDVDPHAG